MYIQFPKDDIASTVSSQVNKIYDEATRNLFSFNLSMTNGQKKNVEINDLIDH